MHTAKMFWAEIILLSTAFLMSGIAMTHFAY